MNQILENEVLSLMIAVGLLKAQGIKQDSLAVRTLDIRTLALIRDLLDQDGWDDYRVYESAVQSAIEGNFDPLRKYVKHRFKPVFRGAEEFRSEIEAHGIPLIIASHNKQSPEIDVINWETASVIHDVGPVVTKVAMDSALESTGLTVSRLVKSPRPSESYKSLMLGVGNHLLNGHGVDEVAAEMRDVVGSGMIPVLSPEGGFRVFHQWSSGPIVLAVKAGLRRLALVGHSPIVSTLYPHPPGITFDYVGSIDIPQDVIQAVHDGEAGPVKAFSDYVRSQFATAIGGLDYPALYKAQVIKFAQPSVLTT